MIDNVELRNFNEFMDYLATNSGVKRPGECLLDSSLITATPKQEYSIKMIRLGEYTQLYYYNQTKIKKDKNYDKLYDNKISFPAQSNITISTNENKLKKIDIKNINRSMAKFKQILLSNENKLKTFITLTFADNVKNLKTANNIFHKWTSSIRRKKKDFLYIAVPEFQERGAVHYHLVTNLDIKKNPDIIIPQKNFTEKQILELSERKRKKMYDVLYWSHGFSSVESLKNKNIAVYMTKYMTKDIDNRLFGHRRYFYSQNITKPEVCYINLDNDIHFNNLADILANSYQTYSSSYSDVFGNVIDFVELKKGKSEVFPHGDLPPLTS